MVHRSKSNLSHPPRARTGHRQLSHRRDYSERFPNATTRWRLIREACLGPFHEQFLDRRTGLDNREVVERRECPILEWLTGGAAFFDVRVGDTRGDDRVGTALRDDDWSLYRAALRSGA